MQELQESVMQEIQNTKVVQDAYAAFGRGDVQALLGYSTNILWKPVPAPRGTCRRPGTARQGGGRRVLQDRARTGQLPAVRARSSSRGDKVVAIGHYVARCRPDGL